ncbi:tRNA (34-2'-O)-methyltransferase regulator RTT10 SCDLUD_001074 [Saccharomycodes ludwigii]|uniref:tRNA (34-2'-O)-methyltransferase regulator RTT10 n=1 Tax=Saccharomycodes ludwigii TaxID=36035 RepID=UPI001E835B37|nr:hypothetical protein SCDLUD_001074 [Saccharomycodes ludwigii]KAH3903435.1 hypothetical protein SCDLUD_001074 [Saccharomycodes ludwigii]
MPLVPLNHTGPSLCVKVLPSLVTGNDKSSIEVWNAQGPYLLIYTFPENKLIHRCQIFSRNKIHGISINSQNEILFYGGCNYLVTTRNEILKQQSAFNKNSLVNKEKRSGSEWIISGEISNNSKLYLLTCYNKVIMYDLVPATDGDCIDTLYIGTKALFQERSILYSGSLKIIPTTTDIENIDNKEKVLVNAGTVMGGILIWDCYLEKLIHNLKGHEGSIFDVVTSANTKLVASCSDDRTIRLWDNDFRSGKELSVAFGHSARIWKLKFINNDTQLISTSEDCTVKVWDIRQDTHELVLQKTYEVHQLKSVWGCDFWNDFIFTCGNDGRVKVTKINEEKTLQQSSLLTYSLKEILNNNVPAVGKSEIIKGFHWFNKHGLIIITSEGRVFQLKVTALQQEHCGTWIFLFRNPSFENYSLTHGLEDLETVVFSNNKGHLLFLKLNKNGDHEQYNLYAPVELCKVTGCFFKYTDGKVFCLYESPNSEEPLVLLQINSSAFIIEKVVQLRKPKIFLSTCFELYENLLLVGSRHSTVGIWDLNSVEIGGSRHVLIRKLTPGDTTTSIRYTGKHLKSTKEDINTDRGDPIFSITNRDGYYNFISVNNRFSTLKYKIIHSNKIVRGFLEDGNFVMSPNNTSDFVISGFKSNIFHISNETGNYEIINEICGGAHRQLKLFEICTTETIGTNRFDKLLVYIKASVLHLKKINTNMSLQTLNNGTHGKEIRDITIKPVSKSLTADTLFITGSEDTTLKLSKFASDASTHGFTNFWTLRAHVSGLQKVKFISDNFVISTSAREELFLWELNESTDNTPFLNLVCKIPVISKNNPDLRIMDFDVLFIENTLNSEPDASIDADFALVTIYSDSSIILWHYSNALQKFNKLLVGKYETCCLLNVSLRILNNSSVYIVVAPTDGYLVYYNVTEYIPFGVVRSNGKLELMEPFQEYKSIELPHYQGRNRIHQSGIRAMEVFVPNGKSNEFIVVTGGDDNGLGVTVFTLDSTTGNDLLCVKNTFFDPKAASSTITSINVIENKSDKDKINFLVCSIDQNLRLWEFDGITYKLKISDKKYTSIADTGSSDTYNSNFALIGGVGLSLWSL